MHRGLCGEGFCLNLVTSSSWVVRYGTGCYFGEVGSSEVGFVVEVLFRNKKVRFPS